MTSNDNGLHPLRDDGTVVGATFDLQPVDILDVVYFHKAGAKGSPQSVNPDYHEGLELLIKRLAMIEASILSISLDSQVARKLPAEDRELMLDYPLALGPLVEPASLRLQITRAQKAVGRRKPQRSAAGMIRKR